MSRKYVAQKKHKVPCALCDDVIIPGDRVEEWCWTNEDWDGPNSGGPYGGIGRAHATCYKLGIAEGCLDDRVRTFEEADDDRATGDDTPNPPSLVTLAEKALAAERRKVRPARVVIIGSTRFIEPIVALAWAFEKAGEIALFPLYLPPQVAAGPHQAEAEGVKADIDELFLRKLDLADRVVVMDVFGYIGESTTRELEYATKLGLPVVHFSKCEEIRALIAHQFPEIVAVSTATYPDHNACCFHDLPLLFGSWCSCCGRKLACEFCRGLEDCSCGS